MSREMAAASAKHALPSSRSASAKHTAGGQRPGHERRVAEVPCRRQSALGVVVEKIDGHARE